MARRNHIANQYIGENMNASGSQSLNDPAGDEHWQRTCMSQQSTMFHRLTRHKTTQLPHPHAEFLMFRTTGTASLPGAEER